jgi:hypothetical protein
MFQVELFKTLTWFHRLHSISCFTVFTFCRESDKMTAINHNHCRFITSLREYPVEYHVANREQLESWSFGMSKSEHRDWIIGRLIHHHTCPPSEPFLMKCRSSLSAYLQEYISRWFFQEKRRKERGKIHWSRLRRCRLWHRWDGDSIR